MFLRFRLGLLMTRAKQIVEPQCLVDNITLSHLEVTVFEAMDFLSSSEHICHYRFL
jgi:hypothetical protein